MRTGGSPSWGLLDEKVVVTCNSAEILDDLLAALEDGLKGVPWHLTVVDNASSDDTVATLRSLAPAGGGGWLTREGGVTSS
jgi:GT2 family glycosyltransferase